MILLEIAAFLILLVLAAYFSAIETALTAQSRLTIHRMAEKGMVDEARFEGWLKNPNHLLTTILVASNLVSWIASAVSTLFTIEVSRLYQWGEGWTVLAVTSCVGLTMIVFGEIIPKVYAKQNSDRVALLFLGPLQWVSRLLSPLIRVILWLTNLFLVLLGGSTTKEVPFLTGEEIRMLLTMGEQGGVLREDQKRMIHSIFEMGEMHVREAMVPRTEMVCVNIATPVNELIEQVIASGYSRLPVYKGDLDTIVGILFVKDLLHMIKHKDLILIHDILRQTFFVPETKKVNELLKEFQKGKIHMAIVVDEFGGTAGLVTLEDLIEEIVGEISDEYDLQIKQVERLADGSAIVDAAMSIGDVNQELGLGLPISEETTSLAGFVIQQTGSVPRVGQKIHYENLWIQVLKADRRHVEIVKVTQDPLSEAPLAVQGETTPVRRRRKKNITGKE